MQPKFMQRLLSCCCVALMLCSGVSVAACLDNVVLVHGNSATPSRWNNTYNYLQSDISTGLGLD